jgi:tetratricopeptide (TPR) repeat protein
MLAGEAFTDGDKQANWVLNELGYALGDVGRYAEAETAFKASVTVGENGGPSVSQAINWGQTLLDLERPKEALASVDNIKGGASPYGVMWADAIRVCANAVLDPAAAKRQLEGMTAREDDNEAALTQALLCLDRQDEAAAAYIRRLASPKRRDGAISAFRVVLPPPVMTARQKEMERRKQAVLARPDVRQALEPVGRALTLPLAGSYWGEY